MFYLFLSTVNQYLTFYILILNNLIFIIWLSDNRSIKKKKMNEWYLTRILLLYYLFFECVWCSMLLFWTRLHSESMQRHIYVSVCKNIFQRLYLLYFLIDNIIFLLMLMTILWLFCSFWAPLFMKFYAETKLPVVLSVHSCHNSKLLLE